MAPSSTITLSQVNLAVEYQDNHIKRQAWVNTFIDLTERLVFIAEFVEPAERQRFLKSHRDWRDNPCLVRYRTDGRDPDFFCQRGADGRKVRKSKERGHPLGIEFQLADGHSNYYYYDTDWIRKTGALIFQRSSQSPDPAGIVIRRIDCDRHESEVDVQKTGISGRMPWQSPVDDFACGYENVAKKMAF
jgi:hypothetical protein